MCSIAAMLIDDYDPSHPLQHQQKDLRLALSLGDSVDQSLGVSAAANEVSSQLLSILGHNFSISLVTNSPYPWSQLLVPGHFSLSLVTTFSYSLSQRSLIPGQDFFLSLVTTSPYPWSQLLPILGHNSSLSLVTTSPYPWSQLSIWSLCPLNFQYCFFAFGIGSGRLTSLKSSA